MSCKGNCWDNAPTESFFNSLKNERVHDIRYGTRAVADVDLFDYIEPFYNLGRQHSTLGYTSPMKFLETGSALNMSSNWRHNAVGLEDEKQRDSGFHCWCFRHLSSMPPLRYCAAPYMAKKCGRRITTTPTNAWCVAAGRTGGWRSAPMA